MKGMTEAGDSQYDNGYLDAIDAVLDIVENPQEREAITALREPFFSKDQEINPEETP